MELRFHEDNQSKPSKELMELESGMFSPHINRKDDLLIEGAISFLDEPPFYFKVFKFLTWDKRDPDENNIWLPHNNKMCRISMTEPKYLGYEHEDLILTKEERDWLIEYLTSISVPEETREEYKGWTNWRWIIEILNDNYIVANDTKPIPEDLPMPDYTLLSTID